MKISTDGGITGYGKAAPLAFVTGETADTVKITLEIFKKVLLGQNPLNLEAIHQKMNHVMYGNGSAKCAVNLALHDIWGKAEQSPVYELLGGEQPFVQNNITVGMDTPIAMAEISKYYTQKWDFIFRK